MITKYQRTHDGYEEIVEEYYELEEHEAECASCYEVFVADDMATGPDGQKFCKRCLMQEYEEMVNDYCRMRARAKELEKALRKVKEIADSDHSQPFRLGSIRGFVDIALIIV